MRLASIASWVLAAIAAALVIGTTFVLFGQGTPAIPLWRTAAAPGPLSTGHAFLEERCESCHIPARGPVAEACVGCHAASEKLLSIPRTVFHASISECASCHVEHLGRERRPITMDHTALLSMMEQVKVAPIGPVPTGPRAEIERLYDFVAGALHPPEDMAASSLNCSTCHANEDRHRGLFGSECAQCHNQQAWTISSFRHPSPRSSECASCHAAPASHSMMHFRMMVLPRAGQPNARVEQCYLCHQVDAWTNMQRGR